MAFKVRLPNNIEIEAGTADELRVILSVVGVTSGVSSGVPAGPPVIRSSTVTPESVSERLVAFVDRLRSPDQNKVLQVLAQFDDWLTDDELRARVGIQKKPALGGVMAALTKNAKAVGLKFDKHVMGKVVKRTPDRKPYHLYRLTPELRDLIRDRNPELMTQGALHPGLLTTESLLGKDLEEVLTRP
jgi:hypothetical protein